MKFKFKNSLLILSSFGLMGCPAGHFYDYGYTGKESSNGKNSSTRIELNNKTDLNVRVGYFYQYIDERENGLSAIVETDQTFVGNMDELIKEVKSSTFGKLTRTKYIYKPPKEVGIDNTIFYKLKFDNRNERKNLKRIKNDTISIEFANGKKSIFVRKAE